MKTTEKLKWVAVSVMVAAPLVCMAEVLLSAEDALVRTFREPMVVTSQWVALSSNQMSRIQRVTGTGRTPSVLQYHTAWNNGEVSGYAIVHTVAGKHGPILLWVATSPGLAVIRTDILSFHERRGRPVSRQTFLGQFVGKSAKDGFNLRSDIDGITGATISSRAVAQGVREALAFLSVITKPEPDNP